MLRKMIRTPRAGRVVAVLGWCCPYGGRAEDLLVLVGARGNPRVHRRASLHGRPGRCWAGSGAGCTEVRAWAPVAAGGAIAMLRAGLPIAHHELGIHLVRSRDDTNTGSRRVIEACGGVFEDQRDDKLRYWIHAAAATTGQQPQRRI